MTDGYVGNDLEVLDLVQRLRGTSRWFPFGTGNGVNRFRSRLLYSAAASRSTLSSILAPCDAPSHHAGGHASRA